jgi:hypothetical protein
MNIADILSLSLSALLTLHTVHAVSLFTTGYKRLWRTRYELLGDPAGGISHFCEAGDQKWRSRFFACQLDMYWWRADQITEVCSGAYDRIDLKASTAMRRRYRLVYQCIVGHTKSDGGGVNSKSDATYALPTIETLLYR